MRRGGKYLQSSTYNSYTAKWGSKQNTVVRGMRKKGRTERMRRAGDYIFYLRETKTRVTDGNRVRKLINKFAWSVTQLSRHVQQRHFQLSAKAFANFCKALSQTVLHTAASLTYPDTVLTCIFFKLWHVSVQLLSPFPPFLISFNSTFYGKWV